MKLPDDDTKLELLAMLIGFIVTGIIFGMLAIYWCAHTNPPVEDEKPIAIFGSYI